VRHTVKGSGSPSRRSFVARSSRPLAALLACALVTAQARPALAAPADDTEAEALIARGIDLREHGKDDDALAAFKKALAKSPSARARAQVALAEQALGIWVAAENDLVLALAADSDAWIAKNRGALEGALAVVRRHIGSLEVRGTDGAEVMVDGVRLGVLPSATPFRVEAGKRTLELRLKGFHPSARAIEVPAGGVARETVTLVVMPADSASASDGGAGAPRGPATGGERDPGRSQRIIGWAFAGTGAALLVTGGVGMLVRKGIVDDYNNRCPGLGAAQPADCDGKIDSARTWLTVSIVSFIAGGVLTLGGITLAVTAPRREPSASGPRVPGGVRVGCAPSSERGGLSLGCSGSF
jgi:hypothetical protein